MNFHTYLLFKEGTDYKEFEKKFEGLKRFDTSLFEKKCLIV